MADFYKWAHLVICCWSPNSIENMIIDILYSAQGVSEEITTQICIPHSLSLPCI